LLPKSARLLGWLHAIMANTKRSDTKVNDPKYNKL